MRGEDSVRTEYTGGQLALSKILTGMHFQHDLEESYPPFSVDIYLRVYHLAIEFDGPSHTSKRKDRERDEYLMNSYNLPVLRFKEVIPERDVKLRILAFVRKWSETVDERKSVLWA